MSYSIQLSIPFSEYQFSLHTSRVTPTLRSTARNSDIDGGETQANVAPITATHDNHTDAAHTPTANGDAHQSIILVTHSPRTRDVTTNAFHNLMHTDNITQPHVSPSTNTCSCVHCPVHHSQQQHQQADSVSDVNVPVDDADARSSDDHPAHIHTHITNVTHHSNGSSSGAVTTMQPHTRSHHHPSIFSAPHTYVDSDESRIVLPPHTLSSFITPTTASWWNTYMFSDVGRRRFFMSAVIALLIRSCIMFTLDSSTALPLLLNVILYVIGVCMCSVICVTVYDRTLVRCIAMKWDFLYLWMINLAAIFVNVMILHQPQHDTVMTVLSVVYFAALASYGIMATIVLLFMDAVPLRVLTRSYRLCIIGASTISYMFLWIKRGYVESSSEQQLCIVMCAPLNRLHASLLGTLILFNLKFICSLTVWPRRAIMLKCNVNIDSVT